jgi:hypothetical protein
MLDLPLRHSCCNLEELLGNFYRSASPYSTIILNLHYGQERDLTDPEQWRTEVHSGQ